MEFKREIMEESRAKYKLEGSYENVFVFYGFLIADLTAARQDQFRATVIRFDKTWPVCDYHMISEIL